MSAAESIERHHLHGAEWGHALADLGVGCAVKVKASNGTQFQAILTVGSECGINMGGSGFELVKMIRMDREVYG